MTTSHPISPFHSNREGLTTTAPVQREEEALREWKAKLKEARLSDQASTTRSRVTMAVGGPTHLALAPVLALTLNQGGIAWGLNRPASRFEGEASHHWRLGGGLSHSL